MSPARLLGAAMPPAARAPSSDSSGGRQGRGRRPQPPHPPTHHHLGVRTLGALVDLRAHFGLAQTQHCEIFQHRKERGLGGVAVRQGERECACAASPAQQGEQASPAALALAAPTRAVIVPRSIAGLSLRRCSPLLPAQQQPRAASAHHPLNPAPWRSHRARPLPKHFSVHTPGCWRRRRGAAGAWARAAAAPACRHGERRTTPAPAPPAAPASPAFAGKRCG